MSVFSCQATFFKYDSAEVSHQVFCLFLYFFPFALESFGLQHQTACLLSLIFRSVLEPISDLYSRTVTAFNTVLPKAQSITAARYWFLASCCIDLPLASSFYDFMCSK